VARSLTVREHADTGFTHPHCETGLCLESALYRRLAPLLKNQQVVQAYAVDSRPHLLRSGVARAAIVGLDESEIETRILDGGSNQIGVCFFTRLADYRMTWNPGKRAVRIWKR
jgi:hypothetical protein